MTLAEKKIRKEIRESLREQGVLPPPKPRLNRKKFLQETWKDFDEQIKTNTDLHYLDRAINIIVSREQTSNITQEQVGILKAMKLAADLKKFEQQKLDAGEESYTIGELYDSVIKPILKL